jgi:cation diffusion facilitator CzcD-associated flavoprotein CzcO
MTSGFSKRRALRHLQRQLPEPVLRDKLRPRRDMTAPPLRSNDFYAALRDSAATVHDDPVSHVLPDGLMTNDGTYQALDALVIARTYELQARLPPLPLTGLHGRSLHDTWQERPCAYLGMAIAGFPNLFLMGCQGTYSDHSSAIFLFECQARYIDRCIRRMQRFATRRIHVREASCELFWQKVNHQHTALARRNWRTARQCTAPDGTWPWSSVRYWWKTLAVDISAYEWT